MRRKRRKYDKRAVFVILSVVVLIMLFAVSYKFWLEYKKEKVFLEKNEHLCNETFYRSKDECMEALEYMYRKFGNVEISLFIPQPKMFENRTGFYIAKLKEDIGLIRIFKNGTVIVE